MFPRNTLLRRFPALLLVVLISALAAAVPMLDRGTFAEGTIIRAEQSDRLPDNTHDHQLCVQFNANQIAYTEPPRPLCPTDVSLYFVGWSATVAPLPPADPIHHTRAPPQFL